MARKRLRPKVYTVGLKDYIAYFFERLFLACFIFFTRFIPIKYLYPVAARIGKIGAVLSPAYKQRVLGNLNPGFWKRKKDKGEVGYLSRVYGQYHQKLF